MIPSPVYDFKVMDLEFKVKVTDLEFLYAIFYSFSFFAKPSMDFIHLWRDDRALSNILRSTIPIPVHDLKVKVADFEFFVLNF